MVSSCTIVSNCLCFLLLSSLHCFASALQSDLGSPSSLPSFTSIGNFPPVTAGRRHVFALLAAPFALQPARAFEGGVGGLGKTKPETGVEFLSPPFQSKEGWVSAEVVVDSSPLLIEFWSPSLPLLPTSAGLEVRKLPDPESAFVQIIHIANNDRQRLTTKSDVIQLLEQHILSQTGKFGAYLTPTDVKVASADQDGLLWNVSFTAYTPGLRESDRKLLLHVQRVGKSTIVLVAGTTLQRYAKQESKLRQTVESFQVVPAPSTKLRS